MIVTGAGISLPASHTAKQTYRREESLIAGLASGDEGFSEETISSGHKITRIQEQTEAFSGDIMLDRFQRDENMGALEDTRTEYLSSLRALRAEFSVEAKSVSDSTLLSSMAESEAVESIVPSDYTFSARDRARIELILTIVEELTGKWIEIADPE